MKDDWKRAASCRGKTDIFFAPHRERPAAQAVREVKALKICSTCPVIHQCEEAARTQHESGIWAGHRENYFVVV